MKALKTILKLKAKRMKILNSNNEEFDQKALAVNFLADGTEKLSKEQFEVLYEIIDNSLIDKSFDLEKNLNTFFDKVIQNEI